MIFPQFAMAFFFYAILEIGGISEASHQFSFFIQNLYEARGKQAGDGKLSSGECGDRGGSRHGDLCRK